MSFLLKILLALLHGMWVKRAHMGSAEELRIFQSTSPAPDHMNPFSFSSGVSPLLPRGENPSNAGVFSPPPFFQGLNSRRIGQYRTAPEPGRAPIHRIAAAQIYALVTGDAGLRSVPCFTTAGSVAQPL